MVRTYEATLESPRQIDIYLEREKPLIKFMYLKQFRHITLLRFFLFSWNTPCFMTMQMEGTLYVTMLKHRFEF
jgi:hypothetical protein